jgi:hypothetical protein
VGVASTSTALEPTTGRVLELAVIRGLQEDVLATRASVCGTLQVLVVVAALTALAVLAALAALAVVAVLDPYSVLTYPLWYLFVVVSIRCGIRYPTGGTIPAVGCWCGWRRCQGVRAGTDETTARNSPVHARCGRPARIPDVHRCCTMHYALYTMYYTLCCTPY